MGIKKTLATLVMTGALALGIGSKANGEIMWSNGSSTMWVGGKNAELRYSPIAEEGFDSLDEELIKTSQTADKFVASYSLVDGKQLSKDVRPDSSRLGKEYAFFLTAIDERGWDTTSDNYIQFMSINPVAGVTDYQYDIGIWGNNNPSNPYYIETGLASTLIQNNVGLTGVWNLNNIANEHVYGSLTLKALPEASEIPEPSTLGLLAAGGLVAAAYGRRRLSKDRK